MGIRLLLGLFHFDVDDTTELRKICAREILFEKKTGEDLKVAIHFVAVLQNVKVMIFMMSNWMEA